MTRMEQWEGNLEDQEGVFMEMPNHTQAMLRIVSYSISIRFTSIILSTSFISTGQCRQY
jgi:hypothetical protein